MSALADRMALFHQADLYVVITPGFCAGRSPLEVLEACLRAGVRLVQLREKEVDTAAVFALGREFRARTREAGALFLIDDRVDLALALDADGVHLGQRDLPLEAARRIAPGLILGGSTHTLEQALEAERQGASYVNIGPIYATNTKQGTAPPLGPAAIGMIAPHLSIPFTCMGGIKLENVEQVLAQGARQVAVVTAVTAAEDVEAAASALRARICTARAAREACRSAEGVE